MTVLKCKHGVHRKQHCEQCHPTPAPPAALKSPDRWYWVYQEVSDEYTHIVRDTSNRFICQLAQESGGRAEAVARLISAAPDMEDLLKRLEYWFDTDATFPSEDDKRKNAEWLDEIRTALAKSKGKPNA